MDKPVSKTAKGESTCDRILDAAEALFLEKGFSGASLADILDRSGLTKGAFFHHFKDKDALGKALLARYTERDLDVFREFSRQAEKLADDPLQEVTIFLKLFEDFLESQPGPHQGCVFALYTYEHGLFGEDTRALVNEGLRAWGAFYEAKFKKLLEARKPALPVTVADLTEAVMSLIEGGIILSRAFNDKMITVRASRQFRNYLTLLFPA
jgi:TetR/AcrR family transcriptional regulator, transcriptional repressor for nem operon